MRRIGRFAVLWPTIEIRTVRTVNPMRPLRGRRIWVPESAGRALARCARPRATHGYYIDRSAVADHPASRGANAVKRRRRTSTRAHGASRGYGGGVRSSPGGTKEERERATAVILFRALRGFDRFLPADPRHTPWATELSRLRRLKNAMTSRSHGIATRGIRRGFVAVVDETVPHAPAAHPLGRNEQRFGSAGHSEAP